MSTPSSTSLVGQTVDQRYEVLGYVASGGMAKVYVAMDTRLDREVALKVMRADLARDQAFVARFRREARSAARLSHPHVVGVYDQGQDDEHVFLAMELVRGRTLREVIRNEAPLTPRAALDILDPVLQALAAAHRAEIVHRDVKPENVLIGDDGVVKVADFGLARALTTETLTTNHDVLLGTAAYLSPEQVEHGQADRRSDVYAATLLLHEMLTGHKAFGGDNPIHVAYQHVHGPVPRPSEHVPDLAEELDTLVALGAAKNPAQRPDDAGELLREVRRTRAQLSADDLDRVRDLGGRQRTPRDDTASIARGSHTAQLRRPPQPPGRSGGAPPPGDRGRGPRRDERPQASPQRPPRAATGSPTGRRRRAPWLAALLALVVVAGGTGWWFTLGPGGAVAVPAVAGRSQGEAVRTIGDAGLPVKVTEVFSEHVARGTVVRSRPAAGADQPRSDAVTLEVSKGPERFTVPALAGQPQARATQLLREASLAAGPVTLEFSETAPVGEVLRSDPTRGAQLKRNAAVSIVVSKGREPIPVPGVTGQPEVSATGLLTSRGLKVEKAPQAFSDTVPAGTVITQTPADGTTLFRGQTVTLTVSKGPEMIKVPSVLDKTTAQARQTLTDAGFQVRVNRFFGGLLDTVRDQDPKAGTSVRKGTVVTISVV